MDMAYVPDNPDLYENMRAIFTILQGAGIIKFKTTSYERHSDGTISPPQMIVYEVNDKASEEWLEKDYIE